MKKMRLNLKAVSRTYYTASLVVEVPDHLDPYALDFMAISHDVDDRDFIKKGPNLSESRDHLQGNLEPTNDQPSHRLVLDEDGYFKRLEPLRITTGQP